MPYIFLCLKINTLKIIVIWFIKGSKIFKIPIKYDFFSFNTNNFHIFEPKVDTIMLPAIWFECLKILHIKICAIRMCNFRSW